MVALALRIWGRLCQAGPTATASVDSQSIDDFIYEVGWVHSAALVRCSSIEAMRGMASTPKGQERYVAHAFDSNCSPPDSSQRYMSLSSFVASVLKDDSIYVGVAKGT